MIDRVMHSDASLELSSILKINVKRLWKKESEITTLIESDIVLTKLYPELKMLKYLHMRVAKCSTAVIKKYIWKSWCKCIRTY